MTAPQSESQSDGRRVWCIWSSKSALGRANLEFGLETATWGWREPPVDGDSPSVGDLILFGLDYSGSNVRVALPVWEQESATVILAEVTSPLYEATAPHWPDEVEEGRVLYGHRFGFVVLGQRSDVSLASDGLLGDASEGLRGFAISHRARLISADLSALASELGVSAPSGAPADLAATTRSIDVQPPEATSTRQGRSSDPLLNRAVEQRAVQLATEHMQNRHRWLNVVELGKPFDLVCTDSDGREKHVEVKGTTGAGGDVEYTPNEVDHFRTCPYGADLIVVRDIQVDRTVEPYLATGGELLHVENYLAPPEDLQPVKWLGRVTGWE